ncbi:alpha-L-rhamnosidase [Paenibacillus spongiae]|uniref:alpha-L-rhamnosidase n=1 Tax=Paenibacillus spongiae TaxID=2909671 RepID=A0ABY5S0X2_9BACL|nr:alpha-L-rhamnosidase [Paenibacillus spongiae]UVI27502.1 glycoside hydrolase family 78 protein [Paenibacillus spongiae]
MLTITKLQVNGIVEPMGLDEQNPRLSWMLESGKRMGMPAASQVWVALSKADLEEGSAILWQSEKKTGGDLHIDYAGPPLEGCIRYWWKAGVWDAEGEYAESAPSFWETGLYEGDWKAEWIWRSRRVQVNDFAYFRKDFSLNKTIAQAKLFMSAHHTVQLHVNGSRVGGFGSPAPTEIRKRKYYLAYDVTDQLQTGENCIAAVAHYLGGDGQNYVNGLPGFRLQLHITYTDGSNKLVKSDSTWQTLREIPHRTGTPYQQNRRMSAIEDYDARKLDPAWLLPGFDSGQCKRAVIAKIGKTEWPMKWQQIPEGAVEEVIVPLRIETVPSLMEDGLPVHVFDTGKIVSGWPSFSLQGEPGITVRMRYSEDLNEEGRVKHNVCNEKSSHYYDQYTLTGNGVESWSPDISYKAFRYVEITGYPGPIEPGMDIVIHSAHTDMVKGGRFRCSDDLLNKMYEASIQTQKNNTLGQTVDCPHREQAQYLADTDLQAETLLYNFNALPILEKTLCDFADGQLDDGTFPFVFPSNYDHPDFFIQIPEWDLHFATLLWKLYNQSGDMRLLEKYYGPLRGMIDYFMNTADSDTGLIPIGKGWHISDWPYPTVDHAGEFLTVQQIKAWQALRITAESAKLIGRDEESDAYRAKAEKLRSSILEHLYDAKLKRLRDSSGSEATHQGVGALALLAGLIPDADRDDVLAYVAGKTWEAKTVLSLPLLRLLFENGRSETAYGLIRREEYPGWGHMIAQGAKTMWEGWDDIESHCHAWNGYPARMMQEYIVGIQAAAPGFEAVRIRPYMPDRLSFAEAAVPTERGEVYARWDKQDRTGIQVELRIPAGMSAQFVLDLPEGTNPSKVTEGAAVIWESGHSANSTDGVVGCKTVDKSMVVELQSGTYHFSFQLSV